MDERLWPIVAARLAAGDLPPSPPKRPFGNRKAGRMAVRLVGLIF